ncbi:MAG: M20/M25/M40 family metallo-hydrolase [Candidatus Krumholzibacteriia bacterium]
MRSRRYGWHSLYGLLLVALLVAFRPAVGGAETDVDFVDLRERLEVERSALRSTIESYVRAREVMEFPDDAPGTVFRKYLSAALKVAKAKADFPEVHARMRGFDGRFEPTDEVQRKALGVFLGDYLQVRYGDDLVRELRTLVGFETYHTIIEPNPDNLQFHKAFRFLSGLAQNLGLEVRNHGNETLEITLPGGAAAAQAAPVAMFTHIDVMRPVAYKWDTDTRPFELKWKDGRWVGLGVYGDKGPVILNLFALRVLRDANLRLARPIVLLVGSTANVTEASVATSLGKMSRKPALVLAADGYFPYSTGEMGNLVARVSSSKGMKTLQGLEPAMFYIYKMSCTASLNAVPAETRVWVLYEPPTESLNPNLDMLNKWRPIVEGYQATVPVTRYGTYVQEDTLHFFSYTLPSHAERAAGRNSIMDMAGSLVNVPMYHNSAWEIILFVEKAFQQDPTGRAAGLWFEHPQMGGTRVNPVQFDRIGNEVSVLVDIRWPAGKDGSWIRERMQAVVDEFNREHGMQLYLEWEPGGREPVQHEPPPAVAGWLVEAYELASGDYEPPPAPVSNSSANLLPIAIPFGPEWPGVEKHGHTRHESISEREIADLGVAYTAALAWFGTVAAVP